MTAAAPRRLACVGASITFGRGLANRRAECYPAVLQALLGDAWLVKNFGYSGATALRESNEPYWATPSFGAATRFAPQVTVINLGTNDAQHANKGGLDRFEADLSDLVAKFSDPSNPSAVLVCDAPPVFEPLPEFDLRALEAVVRPAIRRVALALGAPLVDLWTPLRDRGDLFPDNLHPDARGARVIAQTVFEGLSAAGLLGGS